MAGEHFANTGRLPGVEFTRSTAKKARGVPVSGMDDGQLIDGSTVAAIVRDLFRATTSDPEEKMLEAVARKLSCEGAVLWELRGDVLGRSRVWTAEDIGPEETSCDGPSKLAEEAWQTGKPVWSDETPLADRREAGHGSMINGLTPEWCFPVIVTGRPAAVIELYGKKARPPDPGEMAVAEALGPLLGDWQERIAEEKEQRVLAHRLSVAEERQRLLADTSRVLSDSVDERRIVQELTDAMVPAIADICSVHLVAEDGSIRRVAAAATPAVIQKVAGFDLDRFGVSITDELGVGASIRTGLGVLYARITEDLLVSAATSPEHLELIRSVEPVSAVVAPIAGHGRILGAMALVTADSERVYTTEDLGLVEDIGRRAGVAIAGARVFQRERSLGAKLQAGLLPPKLPQPSWLDMAAGYQPGRSDTLVGGDFYDCFWAPDDRLMFAIGDVCGHGPEAATLTAHIRYAARALTQYIESPASILHSINEMMIEAADGSSQFTAVYAAVDFSDTGAKVTLARAGHPPPLLIRASGQVEEIMGEGIILGCYPEISLTDQVVDLGPEDMLFLYTDGVTDAGHNSERFGEPRLRAALASSAPGASADQVVKNIMTTLAEFDPEPSDDIAVFAIRPIGTRG